MVSSPELIRRPRRLQCSILAHPCYMQARLVKKFAALELGLDDDMLSYRLRQITLLLPDLSEPTHDPSHLMLTEAVL